MKRMTLASWVIMACVTFACGSSTPAGPQAQPDVETIVAETLQALTLVASTPNGPVYQFENITISIPNGVGTGATPARTDALELPFINPSNGPMPEHMVLEINGYPLGRSARILVFKASEYAAYTELTQQVVTTLQTQPYQAGQPIPDVLTLGPLNPQAQPVSSQNGHGLRYITEILTAVVPISNDQIFYYYQGVTNDGLYYISAVLPVNASFLSGDGNPGSILPADGIPFPDGGAAQDFEDYYAAVTGRLNTADAGIFQPPLSSLDSLIQSISIQ